MKLDSADTLDKLVTHLAATAPAMLKKGKPELSFTTLSDWLGKELALQLLLGLNAIRLELVPNYADDMLLVNAFWNELVCEVTYNNQIYYKDSQATSDLIREFGNRWKKPLSEFEVIYSLAYLNIGESPITLHGVEFLPPNIETVTGREIPKLASCREEIKNLSWARVRVRASSGTTAYETGKEQVVNALNLLKTSALQGLAGKMLPDSLFQWKLSGHYLIKLLSGNATLDHDYGYRHPFGPAVIEMGHYIRDGIEGLGLELLPDLPRDVHDRIVRSMHWIARSTSHEDEDYKIVDLCTALEILLIPEGRKVGNKSAAIALRYMLLGGTINPCAVKWLYDRRNDVLHGNRLPVVAQIDIWHLRLVCYTTIDLIVQTSAKLLSTSTLRDLIATVETVGGLNKFFKLVEMGVYDGPLLPPIVNEAKKRLKELMVADR